MGKHRGKGIWGNNKFNKDKKFLKMRTMPTDRKFKKCLNCVKRVSQYHHTLCQKCWDLKWRKNGIK